MFVVFHWLSRGFALREWINQTAVCLLNRALEALFLSKYSLAHCEPPPLRCAVQLLTTQFVSRLLSWEVRMSHAERRQHLKEILTRSSVRSSLPLNSCCLPANVLKQTRDPAALVRAAVSVMKLFECHCSHSKVLLSLTWGKGTSFTRLAWLLFVTWSHSGCLFRRSLPCAVSAVTHKMN